ncbi:MAG: hypothetical protein U1E76_20030 [Planctomycetota bacterium]
MRSIFILLAGASLAACAGPERAPCVRQSARPFGARSEAFASQVDHLPSSLVEHVSDRFDRLGGSLGLLATQTADDAVTTAHRATGGLVDFLGGELDRVHKIGAFAERGARRSAEDGRCFFARTWFSLKMLE